MHRVKELSAFSLNRLPSMQPCYFKYPKTSEHFCLSIRHIKKWWHQKFHHFIWKLLYKCSGIWPIWIGKMVYRILHKGILAIMLEALSSSVQVRSHSCTVHMNRNLLYLLMLPMVIKLSHWTVKQTYIKFSFFLHNLLHFNKLIGRIHNCWTYCLS